MKKVMYSIAILIILLQCICYADDIETQEIIIDEVRQEAIETIASSIDEPNINSKASIVIDRNTKQILYAKNCNEKRAMASTTKIMTAIITLENAKLDTEIEVSKKAASVGGSKLGLHTGDKITINDLLYGLMLRSGNDAAAQLAEIIGGGYEGFAELMNQKAYELGLKDTHFVTPHGLDDPNHYTTAYELALLTDYALENEQFAKIVNTKTRTILINGRQQELYNTNELLGNLNGINGVKTGFTNNAGRCLVCSCKREDLNVISVVLGADTKKFRTKDSIQVIEYVYSNYEIVDLGKIIQQEFTNWEELYKDTVTIQKGEKQNLELEYECLYGDFPVQKEDINNINIEIQCENNFVAPIKQNTYVGKISIWIGEEKIDEIDIFTKEDVDRKSWQEYFKEILEKYKV